MKASRLVPAAAALGLTLGGCTVGPNYHPPQVQMPAAFEMAATTQPATTQPAAGATTQPAQVNFTLWWESMKDPELDSLVRRAVEANLDLKIALARLQEARAMEYAVAGGTMPFVNAGGAFARGTGNDSVKGRIAPPLNAASNSSGLKEITQVVGFDAGWELDLFGRYRRLLEAVAADTQAAAEARNDVLVTLIADVARTYFEVRSLQLRLEIVQQNIEVGQETLDLVEQRFQRGLTNELDVALARRQLASVQATVAPLEALITQAQRRVAVLLGIMPGELQNELTGPGLLPALPEQVATGLPVELLRRRPDIRRAERQLAAETARIGVATADLFPRVAITAGFGMQGQGMGRDPESKLIWSAGPTAIWPLLDFGRIDSLIQVEDYRTQALLYSYRRSILQAVEEVDNALANYLAQHEQLKRLGEALDASHRAVTLATGRYERGLVDFLNVLDAQRQMYALEDQYTVAEQGMVTQYVALYKAIGGGWENYQAVPPIREPRPAILAAGAELTKRK